jgi:cytochrome P450/short-subunit dehydrogenase
LKIAPLDFTGKWVVVTGASSGLGESFARLLASRHRANLVLVARRRDRLERLARELTSAHRIETHVVVADLSMEGGPERVFRESVEGRQVYALISNAAMYWFGDFGRMDATLIRQMMRTNVQAPIELLGRFLPYLDAQNDGGVLVVTSTGSLMPAPRQAVYSGSKAMLQNFVESLYFERGGQRARVGLTLFTPGGIATEMLWSSPVHEHVERHPVVRRMVKSPDEMAEQALAAFVDRQLSCIPGAMNRAMVLVAKFLPKQFVGEGAARVYGVPSTESPVAPTPKRERGSGTLEESGPKRERGSPPLPPGPRNGLPILRYLASQYRRTGLGPGAGAIHLLRHLSREYGDVVYWKVAHRQTCLVTHPDLVYEVLATKSAQFTKTADARRAVGPILGEGLLLSEGDTYKRQRRLVQPAFHHRRIESYAQIMVDLAAQRADGYVVGEKRDMAEEMTKITLAIVCKTLFDAEVTGAAQRAGELVEVLQRSADNDFKTLLPVPEWVPTSKHRQKQRAIRALDEFLYGLIAARRKNGGTHTDLLSMLLAARDEDGSGGMEDQRVRDELITLFLAGHETTAAALTWTLFSLAENPRCEALLRAELRDVLGDRRPAPADVPKLEYTTQVFKEAMRFYPSAWAIGRNPVADVEVGGFTIPAGTLVLCCPSVTHHDPRFFPDPETFRPERFSPNAAPPIPKNAYFPFGLGPRSCIGQGFVMLEAPLILATLLQRVRFTLSAGQAIRPDPLITLRPNAAIWMDVHAPS